MRMYAVKHRVWCKPIRCERAFALCCAAQAPGPSISAMKADYLIWEPGPGYDLAKDALMATVTRPVDNTGCRSASGFRNGTHYMEIICTKYVGVAVGIVCRSGCPKS